MALEQHAFLSRDKVPTAAAWQAAVEDLGFALTIDPELKPFEDSGFLPCKLGERDSGFEIYYQSADELLVTYPQIKETIAPREYAITFRWGGDMAECACVLIASAALAKSCDAVVYYPDNDMRYTMDELIADAEQALAEIENPTQTDRPAVAKRWWEFWK